MCLKDVYSIRLNKKDTLIKEYLKKYPLADQTPIMKNLIIYGIHARQNEIKSMKETNEKLEEILELLKNIGILEKTRENLWLQENATVELQKGQFRARLIEPYIIHIGVKRTKKTKRHSLLSTEEKAV